MTMSAIEIVTKMRADVVAMVAIVRAEHPTLRDVAALAARYGMSVEDAIAEEAKARLRRTVWATK